MNVPPLPRWLRERGADLLSVLLPSPCALCDALREALEAGVCLPCWSAIEYLTGPACPRCGHPHASFEDDDLAGALCGRCATGTPPLDAGLSMGAYRGSLRGLIRLLKFSGRQDLAAPLGARAAIFLRRRLDGLPEVALVVPVPLPLPRRLRRGYNQSAELARALGRPLGLPVAPRLLGRRWSGRPQADLPASRRDANVRGAFRLRAPGRVRGLSVLLVDDIWTTGATLRECARVLRRGGARRVVAFSLARVL